MDSLTLFCCLNKLKKSGRVKEIAVVATDELTSLKISKLPSAIIQNTDIASRPGVHWISYFVYNNTKKIVVDYYDSYGTKNPLVYNIKFPLNISNSSTFSL